MIGIKEDADLLEVLFTAPSNISSNILIVDRFMPMCLFLLRLVQYTYKSTVFILFLRLLGRRMYASTVNVAI